MIKFKKLPANILELIPGAVEYLESHPNFESLSMRKYFDFSIKESAQLKRRYLIFSL
jgi:hypothetical protein